VRGDVLVGLFVGIPVGLACAELQWRQWRRRARRELAGKRAVAGK
jgi:membrane-associated phospholipid phosphatase